MIPISALVIAGHREKFKGSYNKLDNRRFVATINDLTPIKRALLDFNRATACARRFAKVYRTVSPYNSSRTERNSGRRKCQR